MAFLPVLSEASNLVQPNQRYVLFMRQQHGARAAGSPERVGAATLTDVAQHFPAFDPEAEILVGVGFVFSYFRTDLANTEQALRNFLAASEETNVPVWIKLDGEQWWGARPDLWNWWDPAQPGYDPENAANVEWTWWTPEHALKVSWRDWGKQLRVLPPPNLMSPRYRAAVHEAMERLVPIVVEWSAQLPEEKKALFAGLNVGWESSIGINSYYYPNGNELLDQPKSEDPPGGRLVIDDVLSRGQTQIGYAAVSSAGLRTKGDITEDDLVEVVRRHLFDLSQKARELGIPREKLYTHAFGNAKGEKLFDTAVNELSNPGWSEYWNSSNIIENTGVLRNIRRPEVERWGSVEWLLLHPVDEVELWYQAVSRTINAPGLNLMCIYNWENTGALGPNVPQVIHRVIEEGLNPQPLPTSKSDGGVSSLYEIQSD